jgi:hypothetical protein
MDEKSVRSELLAALMKRYAEDSQEFVVIPPALMETRHARFTLSELRNEGYVEEQARGMVRLKPRGFLMCQKEHILA